MEYKTPNAIEQIAQIFRPGARALSRAERLERWAELLEQNRDRKLRPLMRIEFLDRAERMLARADDTPLTVAWEDPGLRAEGLASDSVGDAAHFFSLSDEELHYLVCDCHYMGSMSAQGVADRVRAIARRRTMASLWGL